MYQENDEMELTKNAHQASILFSSFILSLFSYNSDERNWFEIHFNVGSEPLRNVAIFRSSE